MENWGGGEGKKKFELPKWPPLVAKKVSVGRIYYWWPKGEVVVGGLLYRNGSLFVGGVKGSLNGKELVVKPLKGFLVGNELKVPSVSAKYGPYRVEGKGAFGLRSGWFVGRVWGGGLFAQNTVKYYGKYINAKSEGEYRKVPFKLDFSGELTGGGIKGELKGKVREVSFRTKGEVEGSSVFVLGSFKAEEFKEKWVKVEGLKGNFQLEGSLDEPLFECSLNARKLLTPYGSLNELKGWSRLKGDLLKAKLECREGKGELSYGVKSKKFKGFVELQGVSLRRVKAFKEVNGKGAQWLPEGRVFGKVNFKGGLANGLWYRYDGEFVSRDFRERGLKGVLRLKVQGSEERGEFWGSFSGNGGVLECEGGYLVNRKFFWLKYKGEVEVSKLKVVPPELLSGTLNSEGKVEVKGKSVKVDFLFNGEPRVKGVSLGEVSGEGSYENGLLRVKGKTSEGLTVEELLTDGRSLSLTGKLKGLNLKTVAELLRRFGVKLEGKVEGNVWGSYSYATPNLKELKEGKGELFLSEGFVSYGYDGVSGKGTVRGDLRLEGLSAQGTLYGQVESLTVKGKELGGGELRLKLEPERATLSFKGFSLPELKGSFLRGTVSYGLKSKEVEGRMELGGEYDERFVKVGGRGVLGLEGSLNELTVKISGKWNLSSPYLEKEMEGTAEGSVLLPAGLGTVTIKSGNSFVKVIVNGKEADAVGVIRGIKVKAPRAEVTVNMAFVQLKLPQLTGTVSVPAFVVKPEGFYKLYSVSGVYLKLNGGKPSVSDFSLSYVDGWFEFRNVKLYPEVEGETVGKLGLKGLVYLLKVRKVIPYAKGEIILNSKWKYDGNFKYEANLKSEGATVRLKYLLGKLYVPKLEAVVKDGEIKSLSGEGEVGEGTLLLSSKGGAGIVTLSQVPVGEVGVWKSLVSGELKFDLKERSVKGTVNLTKTKLYFNKEKGSGGGGGNQTPVVQVPLKIGIKVLFLEPVVLESQLFRIELVPALNVKSRDGILVIEGHFFISGGYIEYMGKKFKILYGSGVITNLLRKEGRLSLIASAYINGYYVYMKVEGSFKEPKLYLTSDPPLTREQILNLIMTGASPEQVEVSSEIFPAVQVAYYATSLFFKPVEEQFQKVLKLESFSIEPYITRYGETVAKLTVSKTLTKRIRLIGYETTGQRPEYGGSVQLFLNKNYYLELRYNNYYGPEAGLGFKVRIK